MPTITHNGRKINYQTKGKGEPLVFLHGFCVDLSVWNDFIPVFSKHKIIRIDLPGFGGSEPIENPTVEKLADGVHAILEHLEIEQCILIGHSMGGYVSLAFAKKYESHLKGLGIFHSHPFADSEEKKDYRTKSIEFVQRNGHFHYVKQLFPNFFPTAFLSSNRFLINKLTHRASSYPAEGIIGGLELMRDRPDQTEVLQKIKCPVLFIVGRDDGLIPLEKSIEQTALPNVAHIHILEGIGHMGMFEATKPVQKIIQQFLGYCAEFSQNQI